IMPCANCSKTGTHCHFDKRLDGRRKHAYEATDIHSRQQFILDSLLRSIKYHDADLVQRLVEAIRLGRPLLEVAIILQDNIRALQGKLLTKEHHVTLSDKDLSGSELSIRFRLLSASKLQNFLPTASSLVRGDSMCGTKNTVILDGARTNCDERLQDGPKEPIVRWEVPGLWSQSD
ncbi:hypothetical protein LTR55_012204, partial [Exophiala xenobiotica]